MRHTPRSNSRSTFALMALLGMTPLAVAGCGAQRAQAQPGGGRPPVAVTATRVLRQTIEDTINLDGQVVPYLQANVATQTSGTVLKVYANQGDRVRTGQILAKIDDAPLRAQLIEQQGSQYQASARLQQSQIQQPITDQSVQTAAATAALTVTQAQKQLLSDKALLKQNELTYTADKKLYEQGYVAATVLENAHAAYITSLQTLSIDEGRVIQAQSALAAARKSTLNTNLQRQVVAENRGAVLQADGSSRLLQTQIGQTVLTAPFDGVITQRMLDPGSYAGPNQPLFAIAQLSPAYIRFNVKDSDLAYVHPGTEVSFSSASVPEHRYFGRITTINVVPTSGTLLYPAQIVVDNPGEQLRGGMLVNVRVVKKRVLNTTVAPISAITQGLHTADVYEVQGDAKAQVAHQIPVHLGIQTSQFAQISGRGIHPGMTIINNKPDLVQDQAPIAVVPENGPPAH